MHRFFGRLWRKRIDWEIAPAATGASADPQALEKVETRLLTILEMVNEWLQFAEAKNAGLVALDALGLAAILTILPSSEVPRPVAWGLAAASVLLLLSLGISLWSFLPRSDVGNLTAAARRRPRATDNLYFFGDVCGYRPEQLAAEDDSGADADLTRDVEEALRAGRLAERGEVSLVLHPYRPPQRTARAARLAVALPLAQEVRHQHRIGVVLDARVVDDHDAALLDQPLQVEGGHLPRPVQFGRLQPRRHLVAASPAGARQARGRLDRLADRVQPRVPVTAPRHLLQD